MFFQSLYKNFILIEYPVWLLVYLKSKEYKIYHYTLTQKSHLQLAKCSVLHCLLLNSIPHTIKAPVVLSKGFGKRWSKRPYYTCEVCREAASTASGSLLINADLWVHVRPTDSESFTQILYVIHLFTKIWKHSTRQVVLFLRCTLESSGEHYAKYMPDSHPLDNLHNLGTAISM